MDFGNVQLCPNQAPFSVPATLGQAMYRRLHEARRSYTMNPTSQIVDTSTACLRLSLWC